MRSNGLFDLIKTITLDMQRPAWPTVAGLFDGFADRHGNQMVVFEHQPPTEVAAVVAATAGPRCGLFQAAKPGCGLAGIPNTDAAIGDLHELVYTGGNPRQVAHEVQGRALRSQDGG